MPTCTIENADPDIIPSPIQPLIRDFLNSPYIWLPERRADIAALQDKHQIRIIIDVTDHSFRFSAKSENARIRLGLTAIERVWCYCFGLQKIYNFLRVKGAGHIIDATRFPELLPARRLLDAAYQSERDRCPIEWHPDLPCPLLNPGDDDVQKANAVFISVASFLLLHEIGHIVREHPTDTYVSPKDRFDQEIVADLYAMEFTMEKWRENVDKIDHFVARANGIVLGGQRQLFFPFSDN